MTIDPTAVLDRLTAAATELDLDAEDLATAVDLALDSARARKAETTLLSDLRALTSARATADETWRSLIATATRLGIPQTRIAEAAGCTPAWVGRVARAVNDSQ